VLSTTSENPSPFTSPAAETTPPIWSPTCWSSMNPSSPSIRVPPAPSAVTSTVW
jgi:hypothetical protein